jgi:hypothetical protein
MDPLEAAIWLILVALDAVAFAADRLTGWMWPDGTRGRRLHLADWYRARRQGPGSPPEGSVQPPPT